MLLLAGWMYVGCLPRAEAQQAPTRAVTAPPASNSLPRPPSTAAQPAMPPVSPARPPGSRFLVVLDPAHGGADTGAMLNATTAEKSFTLALALALRALLNAHGIRSILTRDSDIALDDTARATIANRSHAAACIVLHASSTGNGVHMFTSSLPPAAVSDRRRAFLPWQTAQAAYETSSLRLESDVDAALAQQHIPALPARTSLMPLDSMTCPAVAIEIAPLDANTPVGDAGYQQKIVDALDAALVAWRSDWRLQP
jgi:N-acetylmuramoyl-L-alanine amidase